MTSKDAAVAASGIVCGDLSNPLLVFLFNELLLRFQVLGNPLSLMAQVEQSF